MQTLRTVAAVVLTAGLTLAGCGGSSSAAAPAGDQQQTTTDGPVKAATEWQQDAIPGDGGSSKRYYRLVTITSPDGTVVCAVQADSGSWRNSTSFTVIAQGGCNGKKP